MGGIGELGASETAGGDASATAYVEDRVWVGDGGVDDAVATRATRESFWSWRRKCSAGLGVEKQSARGFNGHGVTEETIRVVNDKTHSLRRM